MGQTPERRSFGKKFLSIFKWILSFVERKIDKRIAEKKREFFLQHKVEMTEDEIKNFRNKLVLSLMFILTFVLYALYDSLT